MGQCKVTDEQIIEASKLFQSGVEVAAYLGISVEVYRRRSLKLGCRVALPKLGRTKKVSQLENSIELIESGEYRNRDESIIRRHMKRYLVHKRGHKCSICKRTEWENQPIPIICDHIDGDSTNNDLDNFRLVCPNCDAQLPTFKSKNRGKGRKYARDSYRSRKQE